MPVNWSLLNPNIAAQAQTIDPFAAIQKGMAQADQREAQGLERELRGAQIAGIQREAQDKTKNDQALRLMAEAQTAFEAGDKETATATVQRAMQLSPTVVQSWQTQESQNRFRDSQSAAQRQTALTTEQKRNAPIMLQALDAEAKVPGSGKALLQAAGIYDPQHDQMFSAPLEVRNAFAETLRPLVPIDPRTEETAHQRRMAAAAEARAEAARIAASRPPASRATTPAPAAPTGPYTTDSAADKAAAARIYNDPNASEADKLAAAAILGTSATGGTTAERFTGRVIQGANLATAAIENVVNLPFTADTGLFGSGTPPDGLSLLDASGQVLRNAMSSDNVQAYNTMMAGVLRNLAIIESAGLAPTGKFTESMGAVMFRPGDSATGLTRMRKMAEMRQIVDEGLQPLLAGRASKEQKQFIRGIIARIHRAVPFTHANITSYQQAVAKNPKLTYHQWAARATAQQPQRLGTSAAPLNLGQGMAVPGIGAPPAAPTMPAAPTGTRPPLDSFRR